MIGGHISFTYNNWIGTTTYSSYEASALNKLNIATNQNSTSSYDNSKIWYNKNDNEKTYYTWHELINNIVHQADINGCMRIKEAAFYLLSAVNDRMNCDSRHESRTGRLDPGHNAYSNALWTFYSTLNEKVSDKLNTLMSANALQKKRKRAAAAANEALEMADAIRSQAMTRVKKLRRGLGKNQRTRRRKSIPKQRRTRTRRRKSIPKQKKTNKQTRKK